MYTVYMYIAMYWILLLGGYGLTNCLDWSYCPSMYSAPVHELLVYYGIGTWDWKYQNTIFAFTSSIIIVTQLFIGESAIQLAEFNAKLYIVFVRI